MVATTVTDSMASLGELFTQITSWMTSIVTTMTADGNEIMLIPVGIFVVGAAIGLAGRLIGRQLSVHDMQLDCYELHIVCKGGSRYVF